MVTRMLSALALTSSLVCESRFKVMSESTRPNDDALVIRRVVPSGVVIVQRYSAWVWAEMMILIDGSSCWAMASIGLPARFPAQPFSAAVPVWKPPW